MPDQFPFKQFLQSKGLSPQAIDSVLSTVKGNPQLMAKYAPREYGATKQFSSLPAYQPLSPLTDAKNRILNGAISTMQGVLNILPSEYALVTPEDSQVHKAMSSFIDSVSSW